MEGNTKATLIKLEWQHSLAVKHPLRMHKVVGSNPVLAGLVGGKPPARSVPHHPRIQMEEQRTLKAESYLVKPMNEKRKIKIKYAPIVK